MVLFWKPRVREVPISHAHATAYGVEVGGAAGFLDGLLGIGGGNFVVPVLVWLGFDSRKASANTSESPAKEKRTESFISLLLLLFNKMSTKVWIFVSKSALPSK